MPRAQAQKQFNSFVAGLNTEASQLSFPENASLDEANMQLNLDGSRQRRQGIGYEVTNAVTDTSVTLSNGSASTWQTYRWDNVNNDPTLSFGVVHFYNTLYFLDLFTSNPSANVLGSVAYIKPIRDSDISFTEINGKLLVVNPGSTQPVIVTYTAPSFFGTTVLSLKVRDLWGIDDGLAIDERPPSPLSNSHRYNLYNQGWSEETVNTLGATTYDLWTSGAVQALGDFATPTVPNGFIYESDAGTTGATEPVWPVTIGATVTDNTVVWTCYGADTSGTFPSNADLVSLGEKTDGTWDSKLIKPYLLGSTSAPKGKYILRLFSRGFDRNSFSGVTVPYERDDGSLSQIATHFSRVFYGGFTSSVVFGDANSPDISSYIFFSQVVKNENDIGKAYQDADPTSTEISDLVDTDGGFIVIPEMSNLKKMIPFNDQLILLAENGVWSIRSAGGFTALNYEVVKVSDTGAISANSIIVVENLLMYWSKAGIYKLALDQISTQAIAEDITIGTIKTLFNTIDPSAKANAKAYYDPQSKIVGWLYNTDSAYSPDSNPDRVTTELIYNLQLGAFYKNELSNKVTDSPYVVGTLVTPNFITGDVVKNVTTSTGDTVQSASGVNDVTVTETQRFSSVSSIKYLTTVPDVSTYKFTLSNYNDETFHDWITEDFSSYLLTGDELGGNMMVKKGITHMITFLKRTETGFDVSLNPLNASSCFMQVRWDWSDSAVSNRWSTERQVYKYRKLYVPSSSADLYETGYEVIKTKSKVRGYGNALRVYFRSEEGKDMHILGWGLNMSAGSTP